MDEPCLWESGVRYLGGKFKLRFKISEYLESVRKPGQKFVEPFCGACHITSTMTGERYASDINNLMISLWKAVQQGYRGEKEVTEEDHRSAKKGDFPEHKRAFICCSCSFGGNLNGGYARNKDKYNYALSGHRSLVSIASLLEGVIFSHCSYRELNPENCLIYCDPPYYGVSGYHGTPPFNSGEFFDWCRAMSEKNTVVISEYRAPKDFECVREWKQKLNVRSKNGCEERIERLFVVRK